ncbi:class I SAM-dependent methyltransferase [Moritella viscosa]
MEYETEYSINNIVQQDAANYLINMIDHVQPKRILDIGCGSGNVTHKLNLKYPNATIDAIDPSSKMINIAKNNYSSSKLSFICQKIEDFIPEYDYDLVFSNSSFQWWERHDIALSRIADLLAPNGVVAIQTPSTIKAHSFTYNVTNEELFKIFKSGAVKVYTSSDNFDIEVPKYFRTDFLKKFKILISNNNVCSTLSLHRILLLCKS